MADNIYGLIPKIRAEVGAVKKDSTAQAGARYSYRSGDAVINALVPLLNKYGVFTTVDDVDHTIVERPNGSKVVTVATLRKKVTFWAPDGTNVSSTVASESSDYSDKATGAAQSYAYRYALLQTFTLPTDEDDPDSKYVEREAPQAQAAPAKPPVGQQESLPSLREKIKKIIEDDSNPYTSVMINALVAKVGKEQNGGEPDPKASSKVSVYKGVLEAALRGDVA